MDEQGAGTHGDNGMTETAGFTPAEIDAAMALHEGLVRKVAGQYLGGWGRKADDDLLQEGRFGLWQGLRRYDRNRGTEVSTCVVPWIRKYILAELGRRGKYGATFVASLQDPVGEDGERTRGDLYADEAAADPFEAAGEEEALERVREHLADLSADDRDVVERYFGLRNGKRSTLSELAGERGVSAQRIHVRLHRALGRLRAASAA